MHVCVSVMDITTVDCIEEVFAAKLRIYAMWDVNPETLPPALLLKVGRKGTSHSLLKGSVRPSRLLTPSTTSTLESLALGGATSFFLWWGGRGI